MWSVAQFLLVYRVRDTPAAIAAHRYALDVLGCKTSKFASCFLPADVRAWTGLPDAVFESGWLGGFKGAVNKLS